MFSISMFQGCATGDLVLRGYRSVTVKALWTKSRWGHYERSL